MSSNSVAASSGYAGAFTASLALLASERKNIWAVQHKCVHFVTLQLCACTRTDMHAYIHACIHTYMPEYIDCPIIFLQAPGMGATFFKRICSMSPGTAGS